MRVVGGIVFGVCLLVLVSSASAGGKGKLIRTEAEGSCAIVGMTAEQARHIALQRARAAAIEKAAGVKVVSETLVTNARLALDFIRAYSRGYIIKEDVRWLPLGQFQKDPSTAPIPLYRVRIKADVFVPEPRPEVFGLQAFLNAQTFRAGEALRVSVSVAKKAVVGVFNLTADDRVQMLLPNEFVEDVVLGPGQRMVFPQEDSEINLVVSTLEGHSSDTEAIMVVVLDEKCGVRFRSLFPSTRAMRFSEFFRIYSEIAHCTEDKILPYEVRKR